MHEIKQGDQLTLRWRVNVDLFNASTVRFVASSTADMQTVIIDKSVELEGPHIVKVYLESSDTEVAQTLFCELRTTWPNGDIVTIPSSSYGQIRIRPVIGPPEEES